MKHELLKFIKSLQLKKFRKLHSSFFVEGKVNILEALESDFKVKHLLITPEGLNDISSELIKDISVISVSEKELLKIGTFRSNSFGLIVLEIPENEKLQLEPGEWCLALDDVNDPGNLGTIVRTADWFGIKKVFCSIETVDFYNPKVVNSTKGSFSRVSVIYTELSQLVSGNSSITAEMNGKNLYDFEWPQSGGVVLMGNESHGVSKELSKLASHKLTIPRLGGAESLNVGIATSIFCSDLAQKGCLK